MDQATLLNITIHGLGNGLEVLPFFLFWYFLSAMIFNPYTIQNPRFKYTI